MKAKLHSVLFAVFALALFAARSSGAEPPPGGERPGPYFISALGGTIAEDVALKEFPNAPPGSDLELSPGVSLELGGGFRFNDWVSVGGRSGFLWNTIKGADVDLTQVPLLADVEFRLPNKTALVPFIGGGPGMSFSGISLDNDNLGGGSTLDGSDSSAVFAWHAYGGVRYKIAENMSVGVSYRYFWADNPEWEVDNSFQDIRLGESHIHCFSVNFSMGF